jgi:S1-C subfamily serine protease
MIASSLFMYSIFVRQTIQYNDLENKIGNVQKDAQIKINELSSNALDAQEELQSLGAKVGSMDEEMTELKASTSADFSGIIENTIKSVVTIRTDLSQGSGFIITSEGYVVTNYHVIEDATAAGIITYDGEMHQVAIAGYDENMDIALLKITGTFSPLELGDSEDVEIGEKVIAIGNPLGLQFSASEGIVSAMNREGLNKINAYIQTDAALNPGNSGGPLINKQGEVVGINNFKVSSGESLGFALESNYLKDTINEIYQGSKGKDLL